MLTKLNKKINPALDSGSGNLSTKLTRHQISVLFLLGFTIWALYFLILFLLGEVIVDLSTITGLLENITEVQKSIMSNTNILMNLKKSPEVLKYTNLNIGEYNRMASIFSLEFHLILGIFITCFCIYALWKIHKEH